MVLVKYETYNLGVITLQTCDLRMVITDFVGRYKSKLCPQEIFSYPFMRLFCKFNYYLTSNNLRI